LDTSTSATRPAPPRAIGRLGASAWKIAFHPSHADQLIAGWTETFPSLRRDVDVAAAFPQPGQPRCESCCNKTRHGPAEESGCEQLALPRCAHEEQNECEDVHKSALNSHPSSLRPNQPCNSDIRAPPDRKNCIQYRRAYSRSPHDAFPVAPKDNDNGPIEVNAEGDQSYRPKGKPIPGSQLGTSSKRKQTQSWRDQQQGHPYREERAMQIQTLARQDVGWLSGCWR
jgi:hypothetical protein